jgi:hypothetical protein
MDADEKLELPEDAEPEVAPVPGAPVPLALSAL